MKKPGKVLVLIIVSIMCFGILIGCSSGETTSKASSSSSALSPSSSSSKSTNEDEPLFEVSADSASFERHTSLGKPFISMNWKVRNITGEKVSGIGIYTVNLDANGDIIKDASYSSNTTVDNNQAINVETNADIDSATIQCVGIRWNDENGEKHKAELPAAISFEVPK